jgi:hypothetical protein
MKEGPVVLCSSSRLFVQRTAWKVHAVSNKGADVGDTGRRIYQCEKLEKERDFESKLTGWEIRPAEQVLQDNAVPALLLRWWLQCSDDSL